MSSIVNKGVPNAPFYTPVQGPPAGTALDQATAPTLFKPLKIRGVELQNRFVVSPMCMYSADDGHVTDWHFAHLSQFILRGTALTIVEATAVTPNGRISPEDLGIWKDSQISGLKRIVDFAHSQGQKVGIQLAHAGRKASTLASWLTLEDGSRTVAAESGGWPDNVWAPSAIKFHEGYAEPKAMTTEDIKVLVQAFEDAARRAVAAGFDVIEIHGAHGYLITEFLSPASNKRTDQYGGSFENRTRLLFEVIKAVRGAIPESMALFLRISATEWMEWAGEPSWTMEQSFQLAKLLPAAGIDLLDVSSAGNNPAQRLVIHPYTQINFAGRIRDELKKNGINLLIGAVGLITNSGVARRIVQEGEAPQADLVFIGRQLLREPEFVLRAAQELGVEVKWPNQYHRAAWRVMAGYDTAM
ncbi:FMN-linked oxidoreductase [Annulohypoxylon truncatum]|uniref:FMN-linked oxidoreductase n=1 Tax=Annulohypoxylon truncatum TaxID=327061 RepID=UPI002008D209|nr:FMN-linked oxidoreductase [Annulohypoxylon truncatum]KAI1206415.1 FMN-linked oxidoreductase [Annulohypoxylon truncatum]